MEYLAIILSLVAIGCAVYAIRQTRKQADPEQRMQAKDTGTTPQRPK